MRESLDGNYVLRSGIGGQVVAVTTPVTTDRTKVAQKRLD